jgi:hypothetical protein
MDTAETSAVKAKYTLIDPIEIYIRADGGNLLWRSKAANVISFCNSGAPSRKSFTAVLAA